MSTYVISCGGTGGHLSPGIALAQELVARGDECVLLISQKKVDARLIEKYPQLHFQRMPGVGFGWSPGAMARFAASQTRALLFCRRLLRARRVDAIIGFGGFTSAPLVSAARMRRVPALLHEANRVPGRAIRLLGRVAQRVYLPPGVEIRGLRGAVVRHIGLPVRKEIQRIPTAEARQALGLDPGQRTLVVLGGSQGSSPLNDWTRSNLEALAADGIQVYCVTGLGKGTEDAIALRSHSGAPVRAIFASFSDQMSVVMSAADLVLSRAGAGTLAELVRCETPAVLVPFPQAADDHQRANASYFEQQGGGIVVPQTRLSELRSEIMDLMTNDGLLRKFRANLRRMDRNNPVEVIAGDLAELGRDRQGIGREVPA